MVDHTFLVQPGRWAIQGHYWFINRAAIPVKGQGTVDWDRSDWFYTQLKFQLLQPPEEETGIPEQLEIVYRGRLLPEDESSYTFMMQHSALGRVEGEGRITPTAIVHRYWVLRDDKLKRNGFETFFRSDPDHYGYTSGVIGGLRMIGGVEATLSRL